MRSCWFITGTDTGVGKTVFTALLARGLVSTGRSVRVVKPFCSGGREDARILRQATGNRFSLDAINPWHFRAALAPLIAARAAGERVERSTVVRFLKEAGECTEVLLIEGAGGLLSPLGEDYDARDLIRDLGPGTGVIVVASNRLGAINQVRLVVEALGGRAGGSTKIALVAAGPRPDRVSRTNREILVELFGAQRLIEIPRFECPEQAVPDERLTATLGRWLGAGGR